MFGVFRAHAGPAIEREIAERQDSGLNASHAGGNAGQPASGGEILKCAACGTGRLLRAMFIYKEGEPPGHPNHQVVYNDLQLHECEQCARGVLIRMKHDSFDWEAAWDNEDRYWIDARSMKELNGWLAACARPQDPECNCKLHEAMRKSLLNLPELGANGDFGLIPRLRYDSKEDCRLVLGDGSEQVEYSDGRMRVRASLIGGLLCGHGWRYYENGTLAEEGEFSLDKRTGNWVEYNDSGKPVFGGCYENGYRVSSVEPMKAAAEAAKSGKAMSHPRLTFILVFLTVFTIPLALLTMLLWNLSLARVWGHWIAFVPEAWILALLVWMAYKLWPVRRSR